MERYSRLRIGSRLIANMDGDSKEIREEIFFFSFWMVGGDHANGMKSVVRARCHRNRNARLDARIDKRRVKRAVLRASVKLSWAAFTFTFVETCAAPCLYGSIIIRRLNVSKFRSLTSPYYPVFKKILKYT